VAIGIIADSLKLRLGSTRTEKQKYPLEVYKFIS